LSDEFRRFLAILPTEPSMTVQSTTHKGNAAGAILDFATAHRADLIVAGRHGHNVITHLLAGSVSTAILRGANCSVLITPEPSFADIDRLRRALTGRSESGNPAEWSVQLAAFSHRNRGRTTNVGVDDLYSNTQLSESGCVFLDASYHDDEERVEVTLGNPDHSNRQITHTLRMLNSVAITTNSSGKDVCLRVDHVGGCLTLTFPSA
jgi:hypothetical protein